MNLSLLVIILLFLGTILFTGLHLFSKQKPDISDTQQKLNMTLRILYIVIILFMLGMVTYHRWTNNLSNVSVVIMLIFILIVNLMFGILYDKNNQDINITNEIFIVSVFLNSLLIAFLCFLLYWSPYSLLEYTGQGQTLEDLHNDYLKASAQPAQASADKARAKLSMYEHHRKASADEKQALNKSKESIQ